ncbi:hypothetical protein LMH87_010751 [Akanthomyces muscarius]|uniref:Major facilitator superfamily (MFS) profile domain-containing protein n=1 Tax=Akanthomyces muscarius TaxID=2231603 RepID=A0A9W8Q8E2_AKAMU|nr:hypothetical protein LMH87_010751 [Akanthomyces muscarius]KAJ4149980.1 hypothetical protein LMH87_010751 [Akanthomyces muscarius]
MDSPPLDQHHQSPDLGPNNVTVPQWRFWVLAVGICLSLFLSMIDTSVVSTCLYTIGSEFKATQSVNWVALAYSLAHLACAATFAQLSNIVGRRNALIAANTIFFTFSLACGFSQSIAQLIAFRALQGIGGSARSLPNIPKQSWRSLDALGTFLLISAAVLVVFAFQNSGESGDRVWTSAIFIAPLTVGICSWAVPFAWEYTVDQRLKPGITPAFLIALFRNRTYASGVLSTMTTGYPLVLIIFSATTRVQVVSGKSSLISGVMLLPMLGMTAIGGAIAGKINRRRRRALETIFAGTCLVLLGCGLLTTVRGPSDDVKALGFLVFPGLGFGLTTTAATIMATVETSPQDRGM